MKKGNSLFIIAACAFLLCAVLNVTGKLLDLNLASVVKPALLPLLALATLAALGGIRNKSVTLLIAAQLFGCMGDTFLIGTEFVFFASGIAAFLFGHICYITLFKDSYKGLKPVQWVISIACMLAFVVALVLLIGIKGVMLGPMAVYGSALAFLIFTGVAGVVRKKGCEWWYILIGAVLFTFSDSQIAMDTFGVLPYALRPFVIMLTYLAAQALLAIGSVKLIKKNA